MIDTKNRNVAPSQASSHHILKLSRRHVYEPPGSDAMPCVLPLCRLQPTDSEAWKNGAKKQTMGPECTWPSEPLLTEILRYSKRFLLDLKEFIDRLRIVVKKLFRMTPSLTIGTYAP